MNRDPIVEEIHQTREKMLAECDGDLGKLLDRLQAAEKREARSRMVSAPLPTKTYVVKSAESVIRGLVGAIPCVGTALNEAIFDLPSRLEQERLKKFVESLDDSLQALDSGKIDRAYIQSAEFVDFFEDVWIRATKVRTQEKRQRLAALLAGRLQDAESTPFDDLFLDLLMVLSEIQIRILAEHLRAAEEREKTGKDAPDGSAEHRQPSYYNVADSEYLLLIQDLTSKGLFVHTSHWEATELGRAFIRFLEKTPDRAL